MKEDYIYYNITIYNTVEAKIMEPEKRNIRESNGDEDIGLMMWKLETIGKFYPCYKNIIEQE